MVNFRDLQISKRKGRDNLQMVIFQIFTILKEEEGFNLGDFENVIFLKEEEGFNLGDGNISGIPKLGFQIFRIWGFPLMKSYPFF